MTPPPRDEKKGPVTERPWKGPLQVNNRYRGRGGNQCIFTNEEHRVAVCDSPKYADYIVLCVNAHEGLVRKRDALKIELATAHEKFTMHTAHVGAWLSAAASEFGMSDGPTDVQSVLTRIMNAGKQRSKLMAALEMAKPYVEEAKRRYGVSTKLQQQEMMADITLSKIAAALNATVDAG